MSHTVRIGGQDFLKIPVESAKHNYGGALERINAIGKGGWRRAQGGFTYAVSPAGSGGEHLLSIQSKDTGRSVGQLTWSGHSGHIGGFYLEQGSMGGGFAAIGALHAAWTHARTTGTAGPIGTSSLSNYSFRVLHGVFPEWFAEHGDTYDRQERMTAAQAAGHSSFSDPRNRDSLITVGNQTNVMHSQFDRLANEAFNMRDTLNARRSLSVEGQYATVPIPEVAAGRREEAPSASVTPSRGRTTDGTSQHREIAEDFRAQRGGGVSTYVLNVNDEVGHDHVDLATRYFSNPLHNPECTRCGGSGAHLLRASLSVEEAQAIHDSGSASSGIHDLLANSDGSHTWSPVGHTARAGGQTMLHMDNTVDEMYPNKLVVRDNENTSVFASARCRGGVV